MTGLPPGETRLRCLKCLDYLIEQGQLHIKFRINVML